MSGVCPHGEPLDAFQLWVDAVVEASTRTWLCAGCGRRLEVPPPREDESMQPYCCNWQMIELPLSDPRGPALRLVE